MYKNEIVIKILVNLKIVKYVELIRISNTNMRIVSATTTKPNRHFLLSGI
jgi:hypothetical protein